MNISFLRPMTLSLSFIRTLVPGARGSRRKRKNRHRGIVSSTRISLFLMIDEERRRDQLKIYFLWEKRKFAHRPVVNQYSHL